MRHEGMWKTRSYSSAGPRRIFLILILIFHGLGNRHPLPVSLFRLGNKFKLMPYGVTCLFSPEAIAVNHLPAHGGYASVESTIPSLTESKAYELKLCLSYDEEFCRESQTTVSRVWTCPTTKSTWEEQALKKSCSAIPHNCSGALSYHCLINPWQNITLEVCVPRTQIKSGYCAEYNPGGGRIQEFNLQSCLSCVKDYLSTEAYQHGECYKTVYDRLNTHTHRSSIKITTSGTGMTSHNSQIWIYHTIFLSSMISVMV